MKKIVIVCFLNFVSIVALAQAPQKISYQAVARNNSGSFIPNQNIGVKFIIYQGSIGGTISYAETHAVTTNSFGLFFAVIGGGSPTQGNFSTILWGTGTYFVETLIDPAGGTSYSTIGAQQLVSVPYALYAEKAGNSSPTPTITGLGLASVTPTTGSVFAVSVPTPALNYSSGTSVLSLTQGTAVTTATLVGSGSNTVSITGQGSTTVNPSGAGSSFTITTPSYYAGSGIAINSGTIVNTAPAAITPTISSSNPNININPTIPSNSYTLTAPSYSLTNPTANTLVLNNGFNPTSVILAPPTLTLSGTTLTSGVATNSVNLALLPYLWKSPVTGTVVLTNSSDKVGIGTALLNDKFTVEESTTGNSNSAIAGVNTATSTLLANGVVGSSNSTNTLSAGVRGSNIGGGIAVYGVKVGSAVSGNAGRFEILGPTNNTYDAVFAETRGTGASIYAVKTVSTGIAGRFEIQNALNGAEAIYAKTDGIGSAIRAVCGPTAPSSSNVALEVEDGHLKTTSTVASPSLTSITTASTLYNFVVNSTDVAGELNIAMNPSTKTANTAYVRINFRKPYTVKPIIVLTPTTFAGATVGAFVTVTTTDFTIYFANAVSPTVTTNYTFNYFVIEGK
jgi:trimeric autotransporter adhesin